MLNENVIPASITSYLKEFELHRPDVERLLSWWDEFNSFLETFEFPIPEMREKYMAGTYQAFAEKVESIKTTTTPLHDILGLRTHLLSLLSRLLEEEGNYWSTLERKRRQGEIYTHLCGLTMAEIQEFVKGFVDMKGIADNQALFNDLTHRYKEGLKHDAEQLLVHSPKQTVYIRMASACALIESASKCTNDDLSHELRIHHAQPFALDLAQAALEDRGYRSALVRLDYIHDFEIEITKFTGKPLPVKRDERSISTFDDDYIQKAKSLAASDRIAFLQSEYPKRLYSRISNSVYRYVGKPRPQPTIPAGHPNPRQALKDHYKPETENLRNKLHVQKDRLIQRRNITLNKKVFDYLNEVIKPIETALDNFNPISSKRTKYFSQSYFQSIMVVNEVILRMTDEELSKILARPI